MRIHAFLLALAVCLCLAPPAAQASETPDYVRLHVVANSDSDEDQALKYRVRDGVRLLSAALVSDCESSDQAYDVLCKNLPLIEWTARLIARLHGHRGTVCATMGRFDFPEKTYGEERVPAGEYRALRIVLGEGEGRNWWCVLYPDLCVQADADEPVFYSVVGRWLNDFFREVGTWLAEG